MRPMTMWHRLGDKPELLLHFPTVFKLDRWSFAVFHHDDRFRAIGNACNHRGGPLSEGRLHGEFVMCPWHAWEYSVITGKGPEGYDEEQVPSFAVEEREDGVYGQTPPVMPRRLVKHKPSHLLEVHPKPAGAPPRVLVISTTATDDVHLRFSTYYAMIERLNCVQNQVTIQDKVLIRNKVAAFIITGGQDNIQAVAGAMFTFWAELGFVFPPFPFIAHSRGWDAEDMQNNVRQVRTSDTLKEASNELLDRALDFWSIIDRHKAEMDKPMERAGRKANTLPEPEEIEEMTV